MMHQSFGRCLTDARNEVRQVREWLLQPSAETIAACPPALERAVASVQEMFGEISPSDRNPQLIQPLQDLSLEILSAQSLLQAAGALYFGRLRHMAEPGAAAAACPEPICVTG